LASPAIGLSADRPNLAGRVLQTGCRQGGCVWLRVARVESVAANGHGELRRLTGRRGTSFHGEGRVPKAYRAALGVDWEGREHSEYAFCSRERPAYAFPDEDGRYIVHYLDLFRLGGYQLSSARMYMRLCHDLSFDGGKAKRLRKLGYRPGTRSEQVEDASPEDLARF
jgi:hypothetical protein